MALAGRLAGIDIAWRAGNKSALAYGQLHANRLFIERLVHGSFSVADMAQQLLDEQVYGVAIDGPTIITNQTGMRACERAIISAYGSRGVACYPANLNLWADCQSLQLSHSLLDHGYQHAGTRPASVISQPWQIECYPHAALLELFQLPYRLAYKKGDVAARRSGQQQLARLLLGLQHNSPIKLDFAAPIKQQLLDTAGSVRLNGAALKANEDGLDALLCVLIAAYHQVQQSLVFGADDSGFIVVPQLTDACR
jgi:predicted RNase H-like nuclease